MASDKHDITGVLLATASAALFGLSTPFAKLLEREIAPIMLASLFYLGTGIGFAVLSACSVSKKKQAKVLFLRRSDLAALTVVVTSGGVFAPICLMLGLSQSTATTASLLLNLEAVLTALIAWFYFHENCDRRIILGMLSITAGGAILSFNTNTDLAATTLSSISGPALIALACLGWAIDNNFTRKIAAADPQQIAMIKGLVAGLVNFALAMLLGQKLPSPATTVGALLLGFIGYGLSLVFYVRALRDLGNARTSAYFATAPFIGALTALLIFHEPITLSLALAALLMGCGVYLHISENHQHSHQHEFMMHEHEHVHDLHHNHKHEDDDEPPKREDGSEIPHTHKHQHEALIHSHKHYPDLHHRHKH